ncbi:MFS transporter [Aquirhabdus sp.]|uniref:MFS transporter n=1 Tax=Aquirhabdus sp. TaxID=2824160 RepID=UPI00396CA4ED
MNPLATQLFSRMSFRITVVAVVMLYLAHALPLYFFNVAVPAILRQQGVDLRWIGMLSLLYLPWAFKFLWAPVVDRYSSARLGKRRSWILLTQIAVISGVLLLAQHTPQHGFWMFIAVGVWISTFAATQDIAIDGYAIEAFSRDQYSVASTAQSIGVALGSMIGGAGTLWLYEHYGWQPALYALAALIGTTTLALIFLKENHAVPVDVPQQILRVKIKPSIKRVFQRPEIRRLLLVIVIYRVVEAPAMAMLNPMLVDASWSLTQIGVLFSVLGAAVGILAALSTGKLVKKYGAIYGLIGAGWLRSVAYGLLALCLLFGLMNSVALSAAVLVILAIRYMTMTALYAYFMQHCSMGQAGTDFTVLVCVELLIFFLGAAGSGFLAKSLGYGWFFALLAVLSCVSVLLSQMLMRPAMISDASSQP